MSTELFGAALRCAQEDVGPAGVAAVGGRVGEEDIG
jgi:hypothetical protein